MAINYDPAALGGAAFGNQDYDHLKSQGHSDSEINSFIGSLDTTQVSNQYKDRGGHEENDDSWKHYDDSWDGFIAAAEPTPAQRKAQKKADAHIANEAKRKADEAKKKADEEAAAKAKFDSDQEYIGNLTANKKGAGGGIDYDPAAHGGAAFGNLDYEHLKSKGHSDSEINSYLGTLDNSQVSNKYKPQGGHERTEEQQQRFDGGTGSWQDTYNQGNHLQGLAEMRLKDNPSNQANSNYGIGQITDKGLLSYDSTKSLYQDGDSLKAAGVEVGDMLFDVDAFKDINGRQTTGRVGEIRELSGGGYHYTPEWVTNENTTDGGLDIETFSGRGSRDQFSHLSDDQYYEINNQYSDTWANNRRQAQADIDQYKQDQGMEVAAYKPETYKYDPFNSSDNKDSSSGSSGAVKPEDVKPISTNQDPASSGTTLDTSNMFSGYNANYKTSYQGIDINNLQASYEKMGFNFDPNRFNLQGQ